MAHWIRNSLNFWLTGFLAPWLSVSLIPVLHFCIALVWPPYSLALHSLTVLTCHPQAPRLEITYCIRKYITVIVVVFMNTAPNKCLHYTEIFFSFSTPHSVPTQLREPNCSLVQLSLLKLLNTFCVIQTLALTPAHFRTANYCDIDSYSFIVGSCQQILKS